MLLLDHIVQGNLKSMKQLQRHMYLIFDKVHTLQFVLLVSVHLILLEIVLVDLHLKCPVLKFVVELIVEPVAELALVVALIDVLVLEPVVGPIVELVPELVVVLRPVLVL